MSDTPKIVQDAILNEGKIGISSNTEISIYPVTIRRYALLERLGSPFIDSTVEFSMNNIIPSAFVMCRTNSELRELCVASKDKIIEDAFDWAENLALDDIPKMITAITQQFIDINKAAPENVAQNTSKKKVEES